MGQFQALSEMFVSAFLNVCFDLVLKCLFWFFLNVCFDLALCLDCQYRGSLAAGKHFNTFSSRPSI